jgi:tartrate dehydrogenase/decarboxylase/D-malate dehydrogenase
MPHYRIAVIPGDGIGKEVIPQGIRVLDAAGTRFGFSFEWEFVPWGCEYYLETGHMMPADGLAKIRQHDAIYLGAVGWPGVPDHVSLWGLLLPIRRGFEQYINLRPIRLLRGVESPLKGRGAADIDLVIVRENNEGEYSRVGGRLYEGSEAELVLQESVFTRRGVDRVMRYAFELAGTRADRHVSSATKSNGIFHSMPYWDERFAAMSRQYPGTRADQYHIDALAAQLVLHPDWFIAGTIAVAPSGNLNPEREFPSMFEAVHGSAPDIAGKGIANPIGQVWAGALMLHHLEQHEAAVAVETAIEAVLEEPHMRTGDMGGKANTVEMGGAIAAAVAVGQ